MLCEKTTKRQNDRMREATKGNGERDKRSRETERQRDREKCGRYDGERWESSCKYMVNFL